MSDRCPHCGREPRHPHFDLYVSWQFLAVWGALMAIAFAWIANGGAGDD